MLLLMEKLMSSMRDADRACGLVPWAMTCPHFVPQTVIARSGQQRACAGDGPWRSPRPIKAQMSRMAVLPAGRSPRPLPSLRSGIVLAMTIMRDVMSRMAFLPAGRSPRRIRSAVALQDAPRADVRIRNRHRMSSHTDCRQRARYSCRDHVPLSRYFPSPSTDTCFFAPFTLRVALRVSTTTLLCLTIMS
jgi:hypothetical protein